MCYTTPGPLDFVFDLKTNSYITEGVTQEEFLRRVNTGRWGQIYQNPNDFIALKSAVGGPSPAPTAQKPLQIIKTNYNDADINPGKLLPMGTNEIKSADIVSYSYLIAEARNPEIEKGSYREWEKKLNTLSREFNSSSKHVTIYMSNSDGLSASFTEDILYDFNLIFGAIFMVAIYTFFTLGNCSPMFCRCLVTICGLTCIIFSYTAGFGFVYLCGGKITNVHQLMPFLLLGIGVDDMFVMCNAIDQTDLKQKASVRLHIALGHAGPAITITSLTNALAFAFGALSSLEALKSFCLFASMCIVMLYLTVMTVFLAVVTWDTKRVEKKWTECCNLTSFCCSETNWMCCCGVFTTPKQKEYCEVQLSEAQISKDKAEYENASPAVRTVL